MKNNKINIVIIILLCTSLTGCKNVDSDTSNIDNNINNLTQNIASNEDINNGSASGNYTYQEITNSSGQKEEILSNIKLDEHNNLPYAEGLYFGSTLKEYNYDVVKGSDNATVNATLKDNIFKDGDNIDFLNTQWTAYALQQDNQGIVNITITKSFVYNDNLDTLDKYNDIFNDILKQTTIKYGLPIYKTIANLNLKAINKSDTPYVNIYENEKYYLVCLYQNTDNKSIDITYSYLSRELLHDKNGNENTLISLIQENVSDYNLKFFVEGDLVDSSYETNKDISEMNSQEIKFYNSFH